MKTVNALKAFCFLAIVNLISSPAQAVSYLDTLKPGRKAYSAFECSVLATAMQNMTESDRLFKIGYTSGTEFIKLVQLVYAQEPNTDNLINFVNSLQTTVNSDFDMYTSFDASKGHPLEFSLGRLYQTAQSTTLESLRVSAATSDKLLNAAKTQYSNKNCSLIE